MLEPNCSSLAVMVCWSWWKISMAAKSQSDFFLRAHLNLGSDIEALQSSH